MGGATRVAVCDNCGGNLNGDVRGKCSAITRIHHSVANRSSADKNGRLNLVYWRLVNGWIVARPVLANSKLWGKPNFPLILAASDGISVSARMTSRREWRKFPLRSAEIAALILSRSSDTRAPSNWEA